MKFQMILLSSFLVASSAFAQQAASDVTDVQLSTYQTQMEAGCRERGHQRGEPRADAFCDCMVKTLQQQIPRSDWVRAYTFAQQGRHADEVQVVKPYLKQVEACK